MSNFNGNNLFLLYFETYCMPSFIHHLLWSISIFVFPFKNAFLSPRDLVHTYHREIIFQPI